MAMLNNQRVVQNSAEQVAVEAADVLTELWVQLHHLIGSIEQQLTGRFQQPHFEVVSHHENLATLLATKVHLGENGRNFQAWSGEKDPMAIVHGAFQGHRPLVGLCQSVGTSLEVHTGISHVDLNGRKKLARVDLTIRKKVKIPLHLLRVQRN